MRKFIGFFVLGAVILGLGGVLIANEAMAADKEVIIKQSFQAILDRNPSTAELTYWLGKSDAVLGASDDSGYPGVRKVLNGSIASPVTDRQNAIKNIFRRALKRDPRTDELNFHITHATPTNLIRAQLFGAAERRLAIIDVYVNILGRQPRQSDLTFYFNTRSDIARIVAVLLASAERVIVINGVFTPLGREATSTEIDGFNNATPPRSGAQWPYYYRHDITLYVDALIAAQQAEFTCNFTSGVNNSISGTVTDATTGVAFTQAITVRFVTFRSSTLVASTLPDSSGRYSFTGLEAGIYKVQIDFGNVTGYAAFSSNVCISGSDTATSIQIPISPSLSEGEMRIVLSWGENPRDLDSHLVGPQQNYSSRFHVYYADKVSDDDLINLDVDDTTSYGPETVTISQLLSGTYSYYVHDYAGSETISASDVNAKVYDHSGLIADYDFNATGCNVGVDDVWYLFDINGSTGQLTTVNQCTTNDNAPI